MRFYVAFGGTSVSLQIWRFSAVDLSRIVFSFLVTRSYRNVWGAEHALSEYGGASWRLYTGGNLREWATTSPIRRVV